MKGLISVDISKVRTMSALVKQVVPIKGALLSEIGGNAAVITERGTMLITSPVVKQICIPGYLEIETKNSIYLKI